MQPIDTRPIVDTSKNQSEFAEFVDAIKAKKVHVVKTDRGYHIQFGDNQINTHSADICINGVAVANCGLMNMSNNVLTAHGIRVPLDQEKIKQALHESGN